MAKVFLSAGHGGSDPGAIAYGMKEKDINLQILLACNEVLVRHGVATVLSRTTDENDPVAQEVKEANASGANIAVSFHTNAGGGDGSESYYYPTDNNGKRLAQLCENYTQAIGQNSRGVKSGKNLYFVNGTRMTAVLCECAFIDNDTDNDLIDTVAEQKAFGVAYAKAILEYLGIAYVEPVVASGSELYRVQVGAYREKGNAEAMLGKVKAAGFTDAFIATVK
jgi:N-acetylmuramoyl-L-alanine amidase